MSKVGKKPIEIPTGVEVRVEKNTDGQKISFKGPKGELSYTVNPQFNVVLEEGRLMINPNVKEMGGKIGALWGLHRAMLNNALNGVSKSFEKKLELEGVGYKVSTQGKKLILNVGFSNPVEIEIPASIEIKIEKNVIIVTGIDKYLVGQIAANIRAIRPPEPYKGKGIRYSGEVIKRKAGKKAVSAGG